MRKPTFRGRGTHSQGTKWFGTWELQVKLRVLPADGQARAPAQGRASRSTQTPGQEDPNPGLPSTLHLRAVQGRMGKVTLILKPSTSAQSPQSRAPPGGCGVRSTLRPVTRLPTVSGAAKLFWGLGLKQQNRVRVKSGSEKGGQHGWC